MIVSDLIGRTSSSRDTSLINTATIMKITSSISNRNTTLDAFPEKHTLSTMMEARRCYQGSWLFLESIPDSGGGERDSHLPWFEIPDS